VIVLAYLQLQGKGQVPAVELGRETNKITLGKAGWIFCKNEALVDPISCGLLWQPCRPPFRDNVILNLPTGRNLELQLCLRLLLHSVRAPSGGGRGGTLCHEYASSKQKKALAPQYQLQ
jgi:hypothetical protein